MSTILPEPPPASSSVRPRRKRWTRAECAAMEAHGLWNGQRYELIDGELLLQRGKNRPHVYAAWRLLMWLVRVFGEDFVQSEGPIDVSAGDNETSEPEPDISVLARPHREFRAANPGPGDLRLLAEVSDSTLAFDLTTKASLCARAEIAEYWVLDVNGERLIVHRDPHQGRYGQVVAFGRDEEVAPLASPGMPFRVADAFAS